MDYARILHFKCKIEEFKRVSFSAVMKRNPNELVPFNIDYSHAQVIDLSSSGSSTSSSSSQVVPMAKDSDNEDHTSRMVKYSSLEPSFLYYKPNVEDTGRSRQTKIDTSKAILKRYKSLGNKLESSSSGSIAKRQFVERIIIVPVKVGANSGVFVFAPSEARNKAEGVTACLPDENKKGGAPQIPARVRKKRKVAAILTV
ncbi:hypothetical protein ACOSP7_019315 [Xanthoceras sorbifolium]